MSSRGRSSRGRGRGGASSRSDKDGDLQMGDAVPTGPSRFNPYGSGRGRGRSIRNTGDSQSRLKSIEITFTGCKGASVSDLVAFILRKTHVKLGNARGNGDVVTASVYSPDDAKTVVKSSGLKFAGNILSIRQQEGSGDVPMNSLRPSHSATSSKDGTIDTLKQFLVTRYAAENKMLDLSRIAEDPTLSNFGIVANTTTSSKLFLALMKLLSDEKMDVVSITLEGNKLKDVSGITSLAQSFPKLRNLSLANNDISRYKDLDAWAAKSKLSELQELILTGNPVREDEMAKNREIEYRSEITKRFPSLKLLDNQPLAQGITFDIGDDPKTSENAGRVELPAAIVGGFYENETIQATAMEFLGRYFPAYDGDRSQLGPYYAENAIFSMSINVAAPRKKSGGAFTSNSWQNYIHSSRNLTRITALDARISRSNVGPPQILQALKAYPASKHDLSDANLFCVDAWSFPTSEGHVHVQICVHGEFQEKTPQTKQVTKRSFDRTFILGPAPEGQGVNGVIIKSDLFVIRAWGGHNAWRPTAQQSTTNDSTRPAQPNGAAGAARPDGISDQQYGMINQLKTATGLNTNYANMCLSQLQWDYQAALKVTQDLKSKNGLPAEAFV
ncbi:mRNA export factor mex67 [Taphrina deformans PYCC 5710]|uniref:mRNA export factor MEX67 n=1 Tax=Taphrina deformans (strain PYCC 5710 / ATCC 11124 / CBS 356.35 / IMI 108563 / JCM 9778 / NBRC 8474) TaxID=1097556 RepID=R4XCL5_TAPDE|nr:mRNA export factor mex67 [Taphrina deformans PYCC 5710]|eukprot:CCG82111.1 mRNA export factor mex67 [Taphrina deformans PYCC 5710]